MKTDFHTTMKIALVLLFSLVFGNAQAQRLQSHVLELQNRIESQVDRNLTNLISTQLAPGTFDVSARVKVVEVPTGAKPPKKNQEPENMPAGLDLGTVDVREVIESYKNQIEEMKAFRDNNKQQVDEPKFSVTRIEVVVGLSDIYDDAYVAQFQEWIQKRVKTDYGSIAVATVNKAKPLPVKEAPGLGLRDFLPALGFGILALALVLAAWLLAHGLIRLGEGAKSIIIEHKNAFNLEHNQRVEQKSEEKRDLAGEGLEATGGRALKHSKNEDQQEFLQAGEELAGKIIYLYLESVQGVQDLVRFWLDNGKEGCLKTAVLIDMLVTLKEKVSVETSDTSTHKFTEDIALAISALKIPLESDSISTHGASLGDAYREAAAMNAETKLEFLEKIYWDLLQIGTLGPQSMRKPFDYLQSMNDMAFAEAIKTQPDDTKALALMFGDPKKAKAFMSGVSDTEKEKLVTDMMGLSQVSKKQLWDIDSAMKLKLINSATRPEDNLVDLFPRTIDMLNTMSPVDEIKVLRKSVRQLPDQGATVKTQLTSLAFIDEWHPEYVGKLVKVSTTQELTHLIQLIPESRDVVLSTCPEKMKMIIQDDLKMASADDNAVAKTMKQLKGRWRSICTAENLAMGNVINPLAKPEWMKNVA
jgi:cell division protein FtsL